jgi:protein disulfide-isomerase
MKKIVFCLLACWTVFQIKASEDLWMTDLPKAQARAKAEKKLVFMDFTGSDWCLPCMELKKNVLSSPEFEKFAKDNLVLVEVDFPNSKPQAEELKKANEALSDKFKVEGFPTLIVLNSDGKELSRNLGGVGKPKDLIAKLEKLKNKS